MGLKDLNLKYKYRTDYDSLNEDFYNKCLVESVRYDRASGYFTSGSLSVLAKGLLKFIDKDSKIRLVCNPYLTEADYKAINKGYKSKTDVILESLLREIKITQNMIENEPLNTLSWLIHMGKLDIKIAYTENNAIYHEKFGIFYDDEDGVIAFSGSSNETVGGLVHNFEKIDVFYRNSEKDRIMDAVEDFQNLWDDKTEGLIVQQLPDEITSYILDNRKPNRPIKQKKDLIEQRAYQIEAVKSLSENNWNGIFNMATGTGKTITSLLCAQKYIKQNGKIFLIVFVPLIHLVDQWIESLNKMGFDSILKCYDSKKKWENKLDRKVRNYNLGLTSKECIVVVYNSAASSEFQNLVEKIVDHSFLIADECHNFGIKSLRNNKFNNIKARLGLSATPDRWWDEEGTDYIYSYFGDVVYEYDLEKAIKNNALVPYFYNPIIVNLTDDEMMDYISYTHKIIKWLNSSLPNADDEIKKLNTKRSLLISKAYEKKQVLYKLLSNVNTKEQLCHTLVYCGPSEIDEITSEISKLGFRVHRFDSRLSNIERSSILEAFERKDIQILVAIKCLDEGVDIPSTRTAYFLASTSNPREFVQRRGRILRNADGKIKATINDFVVLPNTEDSNLFKSIVSKEMPRFAEFSRYAINKYVAREEIKGILEEYELEYLMDKLPWEVYHETKERFRR